MTTTATPDHVDLTARGAVPPTAAGWARRLWTASQRPVPSDSVAFFRFAFGCCGALVAARFVAHGWVERLYLRPSYHFGYPGLAWVRPLPAPVTYGVFALMVAAGLALAAGWRPRLSAGVFTLSFVYAESIEATTYLNHYELITLVGVLGCALSLPGRGSARRATVPAWVVWLLRFQLAVVYGFAAVGKFDVDWLVHGEPLRTWLAGRTDRALIGPALGWPAVAVGLSWAGAFFDVAVVPALLWRRTRRLAYGTLVAFHLATAWLFPGIGAFPLVMVALTPIFFDPAWPRRVVARLGRARDVPAHRTVNGGGADGAADRPASCRGLGPGGAARRGGAVRVAGPSAVARRRLGAVLVVGWVVVQLLMPLRHLAYPGDVRWTEEGYRWSWRVLLTEKEGSATFTVTDPSTGRATTVYPGDELEPFQERAMSTRPGLLAQYARHLADQAEAQGRMRPVVTVEAWVAMAGRPRRLLIDPDADLAAAASGPWPARYLEPSPLDDERR